MDGQPSGESEDWGPFGRPLFKDPEALALRRVGVVEGIGTDLGGLPDVGQQLAGLGRLPLLAAQLRQGNQRGQLFLDQAHRARAGQGVEQALFCRREFSLCQCGCALWRRPAGAQPPDQQGFQHWRRPRGGDRNTDPDAVG